MLKRILQFFAAFFIALPLVSFLPLFIQKTMTRSMTEGGDVISYSWTISTFYGFLSNRRYSRPEENLAFWLSINFGLACLYAWVIALVAVLIFVYLSRRKGKIISEN